MPITQTAAHCSDDYCNQLQDMVLLKMQSLRFDHRPSAEQWQPAARTINTLVDNFLVEWHAVLQAETEFQTIWDAIAGKENAVRVEARKFLNWFGVKKGADAVDPVALYLKGPLDKALRELEKCAAARDEAEESLWETIKELPAVWTEARAYASTGKLSAAMAAADAVEEPSGQAPAIEAGLPPENPESTGVEVAVVGSLDALDQLMSPAL